MTEIVKGRWFPEMPPALDGETDGQYTNRLTGADNTWRSPYGHVRYRECSLGFHETCSKRGINDGPCKCPCHTEMGQLELRVDGLEELVVAAWGRIAGFRSADSLLEALRAEAEAITARKPDLTKWYLEKKS